MLRVPDWCWEPWHRDDLETDWERPGIMISGWLLAFCLYNFTIILFLTWARLNQNKSNQFFLLIYSLGVDVRAVYFSSCWNGTSWELFYFYWELTHHPESDNWIVICGTAACEFILVVCRIMGRILYERPRFPVLCFNRGWRERTRSLERGGRKATRKWSNGLLMLHRSPGRLNVTTECLTLFPDNSDI